MGVQDFEPGTRSTRVKDLCFLVIWTNIVQVSRAIPSIR